MNIFIRLNHPGCHNWQEREKFAKDNDRCWNSRQVFFWIDCSSCIVFIFIPLSASIFPTLENKRNIIKNFQNTRYIFQIYKTWKFFPKFWVYNRDGLLIIPENGLHLLRLSMSLKNWPKVLRRGGGRPERCHFRLSLWENFHFHRYCEQVYVEVEFFSELQEAEEVKIAKIEKVLMSRWSYIYSGQSKTHFKVLIISNIYQI